MTYFLLKGILRNNPRTQNYPQVNCCYNTNLATKCTVESRDLFQIGLPYLEGVDVIDREYGSGHVDRQSQPTDDYDENGKDEEIEMVTASLRGERSISWLQ